ncbi:hypothetical protein Tco_0939143 [Tanacetum coccineum]|uniref:Uncharacterized protein n=1 Tax=Tanacetum coccineum TaxID=301880 RepID=A0ABQ5DK55_9ASTR
MLFRRRRKESRLREKDESNGDEFANTILLSDEDSGDRIEPESHKDKPEEIVDDEKKDDDDKHDDAKDDNDDDDHDDHLLIRTQRTGSSEIRTQKMQTPIPSPPRSPRTDLSSDKTTAEELTVSDTPMPDAPSQDLSRPTSSKHKNLPRIVAKMSTRRVDIPVIDEDEVISEEETPKLIDEFQNIDKRVPTIYDHERMEATIRDMLSNQFRDAEEYAYHMKQEKKFMENQVVWESRQEDLSRLKQDAKKYYTPKSILQSCTMPFASAIMMNIRVMMLLPRGGKGAKRQKTSKSSKSSKGSSFKQPAQETNTSASEQPQQQDLVAWVNIPVIDKDEVILEDETFELINEFQNVNKQVVWESRQKDLKRLQPDALKRYVLSLHKIHATSFPEEDLEEKMIRLVRKVFKTFNEEARLSIQHWKDLWHKRMYKIKHTKVRDDSEEVFSDHKIVEIVKVTTEQQYGLDFMERIIVMRENDKPDSFSKADLKYLKKNDIKDMYYMCLNNKNYRENKLLNSLLTFNRSCVIWERVHDFQLGIESYQIKINLTAPTLTFSGIEACNPYSIVDKPIVDLIYLNNKEEKRIMDLVDIAKFCDATLEKVLNEVKLKIFETEFKMKTPLLGKLDLKIMKAYE